jgi:hypothetical protein
MFELCHPLVHVSKGLYVLLERVGNYDSTDRRPASGAEWND